MLVHDSSCADLTPTRYSPLARKYGGSVVVSYSGPEYEHPTPIARCHKQGQVDAETYSDQYETNRHYHYDKWLDLMSIQLARHACVNNYQTTRYDAH